MCRDSHQVFDAEPLHELHLHSLSNFIDWFRAVMLIVAQTDLVLTLPRRLATLFASFVSLSVFDPPIALGEFDYIQVWHERRHHDPLHIWLRELIAPQTS